MSLPLADVALLTDRRYTAQAAAEGDWYLGNILADDRLLQAALQRRGLSSVRVDWADPAIVWSRFRCAVFRTTWDYFERFAEFSAWLSRVTQETRLCNTAETVRWNMDKHYLEDLRRRGVPVVPSRYIERGCSVPFTDLLDETGWKEVVVKPCVSGAARHTYRANREKAKELEPIVRELLSSEALILQPFQESIVRDGEDTLMVIGGRYTHAVRKIARKGDFRVQDDHGGTVHPLHPLSEQVELAEWAMSVCHPAPGYGRVDMVRDNDGQLAVMELELIEPELWLRCHPPAAEWFADAIVSAVANR